MQGRSNFIHQSLAASLLILALASGCASSQRTAPSGTSATPQAQTSQDLLEATALDKKVEELYQASQFAEAIPLAKRSLELKVKALGPEHPDVAQSLNNLALSHHSLKQYSQAEQYYKEALTIKEKTQGPRHAEVATAYNNLGLLYQHTGQYAKANPLLERALAIKQAVFGPQHPTVATGLNNLAELYRATGQFLKAEPLHRQALGIREKVLGPEHLEVAESLNNLAELYLGSGDYAKGEPLIRRATAIREMLLGSEHYLVMQSLSNQAAIQQGLGRYAEAESIHLRVLAIREKTLGSEHPAVTVSLHNLAQIYMSLGRYSEAEPLMQRALTLDKKIRGPKHPDVASSLASLASLYQEIGDYGTAETLHQQALVIREEVIGHDSPDVAKSLNALAQVAETVGDLAKAEALYRRALAIFEKSQGSENLKVAAALNNLAGIHRTMRDYTQAESLQLQALAISERLLGSEHLEVANMLNNLAGLYRLIGAYTKAASLYQRALAINENVRGTKHPMIAILLSNKSGVFAAQKRYHAAHDLSGKALLTQDTVIQNVFSFTTEMQKLQFIRSISGMISGHLSLIHQHLSEDKVVVRDALELVLRRKGIVFDAQARTQASVKGQLSEPTRLEWERLSNLRSEFARLLLNKPEKLAPEVYQEQLATLSKQIEEAERSLASQSGLVAQELAQRKVTVEQVAKQLPTDAALVEFVKIRDFDFTKGQARSSSRYLAFVLTSDGDVTLVDLGEATVLERQIGQVLDDLRVAQKNQNRPAIAKSAESLRTLATRLWAPLTPALGNAEQVILSPDGLLNLVPFAALPDGENHVLVERYRLAYVTSGRELVGTKDRAFHPTTDLLLVANPAYDSKVVSDGASGTAQRSRDFRGHFGPLPGTEREAQEIPPLVTADEAKKQVAVGATATEGLVKGTWSPRILHLATHGFFLPDKPLPVESPLSRLASTLPTPVTNYENPLVRSGLAFAGANQAVQVTQGDDGILTALEITGMDLHDTELVVLSACETAVGTVQTGEGVFGLRRAFALAGAKNLLMSLWPVDDLVTAEQMKAFYQYRRTLPPAEALRQAQLETIQTLKARFGVANPGLWAPFILQGAHAF